MTSVVYFAQEGDNGPVKVGWSRDAAERLGNLAVGNSNRLRLLHTVPGGPALELHIHELLAEHRIRGEWFHPSQPVLDLIGKVQQFGSSFFGAGFAEPVDLSNLFIRQQSTGSADDVARMEELAGAVADLAATSHRQKDRVAAVSRCLGQPWNRALEFLNGRARRIENWEMRRAEEALVVLLNARARGEAGAVALSTDKPQP
jgi:hypothetical protein